MPRICGAAEPQSWNKTGRETFLATTQAERGTYTERTLIFAVPVIGDGSEARGIPPPTNAGGDRVVRRYPRALLCIAAIGLCSATTYAAGVTWQASAGFEKTWKESRWVPIFVDIENTGPSRTGELRIVLSASPQGGPSTSYSTRVDIPQHSRKRYCVCVPSAPMRVALLNTGWGWEKKEIEEGTRVGARDTLVVVIGGDQGFLNFLRGERALPHLLDASQGSVGAGDTGEFQVSHVGWDQLPDRWLGWDCADAVVLGDARYAAASPDGLRALTEWVRLGGTLLVPGGSAGTTLADGPLAPLLPMMISGTTTVPDMLRLGTWLNIPIEKAPALLCSGALRPEARVLCGDSAAPLVLRGRADAGRVVMATFDYRSASIKHWDGQADLWRALAQPEGGDSSLVADAAATDSDYYGGRWNLPEVAKYAPQARLPSLWLVALFLLAYIVVLVPVNYFALRRIDRMELAWLTSPLIVIAFTLAAYFIGYAVRGGQLIVNRVSVVEASAGDTLAPGHGFVGIFSPTRARYAMTLPHFAASAEPAGSMDSWGRRPPSFRYEDTVHVSDISMDMWTSQAVTTRFALDLGKGISGVAQYDGAGYTATIRNGAPFALKDARLVNAGSAGPQANIAPGSTGALTLIPGKPGTVTGYPIGGEPPHGSQSGDLHLDAMAVHSLFFDRRAYYGPIPNPHPTTTAVWLLAFTDPAIDVGSLDRRPNRAEDVSIVLVRLPVRLTTRKTTRVPQSAISVRLLPVGVGADYSGGAPFGVGGPPGMRGMPGMGVPPGRTGTAVWEYTLPLTPATHRVDKLSIVVTGVSGGSVRWAPGTAGEVAVPGQSTSTPGTRCTLYNVATGKWEEQEKLSPLHLANPEQYIDAEGRLVLKQVFSGGYDTQVAPLPVVEAALAE